MVILFGEFDSDAPRGMLSMPAGNVSWRIVFVLSVLWVVLARLTVKIRGIRSKTEICFFHLGEIIQGRYTKMGYKKLLG